MKISEMLLSPKTEPIQIVLHPDFSRAAWRCRSETYKVEDRDGNVRTFRHDTPLDSILRGTQNRTAEVLRSIGL